MFAVVINIQAYITYSITKKPINSLLLIIKKKKNKKKNSNC